MHGSNLVGALALGCVVLGSGCGADDPGAGAVNGASSVLGVSARAEGRTRCAVQDPSPLAQEAIEADIAAALSQRALGGLALRDDRVRVPVHVHVITTSDGEIGDVSDLVPPQMDVLGDAYGPAGIGFRLDSVEVVPNDAWFYSAVGSREEKEMKATLRLGGPDALNIYTTNGDIYLGWATFPSSYRSHPDYDGVVVYYATLPGTGFHFPYDPALEPDGVISYDEGDTGTHEVGHWLGLYHTFQGGCAGKGDQIDDTPAEAEPQFFCVESDSCTGRKAPGLDPIHNFMDYVDDACMFEFTSGQDTRMRDQWDTYRG